MEKLLHQGATDDRLPLPQDHAKMLETTRCAKIRPPGRLHEPRHQLSLQKGVPRFPTIARSADCGNRFGHGLASLSKRVSIKSYATDRSGDPLHMHYHRSS